MSADRNLLFGILAVQLDFVSQDELMAGMNAWLLDKAKPLGDILRDRGTLAPGRLQLLDALVDAHVQQHGNDPRQSLAALSSVNDGLRQSLASVADTDVQKTLAQLDAQPPATPGLGTLGYVSDGGGGGSRVNRGAAAPPSGARYRILRPHAKGGLGEVFVAEDTELGRSVALKEIQGRYADDATSRSRFVLEAEITGGLEHPGIVPVYGLGNYGDGRPFYAMRFIKGDNLKDAIKQFHGAASGGGHAPGDFQNRGVDTPRSPAFASLEFRDLLRRFVDACSAVAYAHSRGVLHRDLKPGNVMLGKYGETLVVDWGLAKVTGRAVSVSDRSDDATLVPRSSSDSSATAVGRALGTPAYMSPEQADGRHDDLGPATDVYSLGATLYEVLTGKVPFVASIVTEQLDAVKAGRFPAPRAVVSAVPTPLEAVCLKAMALKPADRYASTTELARDVERWLADEPVTAYREPFTARARRWVRRHARLATGVGAALGVGVVGLSVGSVLLAAAERRERAERVAKETALTEAERERDRALAARKRTREALDAMVSKVTGDSLTTQKALSVEQKKFLQGMLGYYEEFAAEPGEDRANRERVALAHNRLGMIRYRLGQREEGVAVFRRAAELYGRLAADFPAVPEYRSNLALSHHDLGLLLAGLGQRPEAETAFRTALALRQPLAADFPAVPEYRSDLAASHNSLGNLFAGLRRQPEAEASYRAALALQQPLAADFPAVPEYRRELAQSHNNLGNLLTGLGQRPEAEAAYRAALTVLQTLAADFPTVPEYRRDLARSHNNLGNLFASLGQRPEAEAAYRTALALQQALAADFPAVPDYRRELAGGHNNMGAVLADRGKRPEAEAAYRAALALQHTLAADFPTVPDYRKDLARSHYNLGNLLFSLGQRPAAEMEYRAALALFQTLAADFPAVPDYRGDLARSRHNLGTLLAGLGRRPDAEAEYRAALALRQKLAADFPAVPAYRSDLAVSHYNLGFLLAGLGRSPEAEAAYRAALALQETLAADFPAVPAFRNELTRTRMSLADLLIRAGNAAGAVAAIEAVLASADRAATFYNGACVLALASAATGNADAERHAARAVSALQQAIVQGYRDIPHLLEDADLAALRRRDDFAALLWDLADGLPPAK